MEARPPDTRWRFVAPWSLKPKPAQKPEPKIARVKKMKSVKKPMNKKKAKSDSDEDKCLWSAGSRIVCDPSGAKCKITGGECLYRHTPKIVRKVVSRITSLDKDLSSPLDFEPPDEDTSDESSTIETFNLQRVNPVAHSFKKREEEILIEASKRLAAHSWFKGKLKEQFLANPTQMVRRHLWKLTGHRSWRQERAFHEKLNAKHKVDVSKIATELVADGDVNREMVTESDGDVEVPAGNVYLKVPDDSLTNPVRRKTIQLMSPTKVSPVKIPHVEFPRFTQPVFQRNPARFSKFRRGSRIIPSSPKLGCINFTSPSKSEDSRYWSEDEIPISQWTRRTPAG